MLRISPKLISVELNRVGEQIVRGQIYKKDSKIDAIYGGGKGMITGDWERKDKEGRFPTQLFTNIKNDRYKYVKNITTKKN